MKILLYIFLALFSLPSHAQTVIGSKAFKASYNVKTTDSTAAFRATGYADYTVKAYKDGLYNFTVQVINNAGKGSYFYIYSPATAIWSNAYMYTKPGYQNITTKVTLNTSTNYVRLYFADSATVNNISYSLDSSGAVDLAPILSRLSAIEEKIAGMQKAVDTLPVLYIQKGYGTKDNPIKP